MRCERMMSSSETDADRARARTGESDSLIAFVKQIENHPVNSLDLLKRTVGWWRQLPVNVITINATRIPFIVQAVEFCVRRHSHQESIFDRELLRIIIPFCLFNPESTHTVEAAVQLGDIDMLLWWFMRTPGNWPYTGQITEIIATNQMEMFQESIAFVLHKPRSRIRRAALIEEAIIDATLKHKRFDMLRHMLTQYWCGNAGDGEDWATNREWVFLAADRAARCDDAATIAKEVVALLRKCESGSGFNPAADLDLDSDQYWAGRVLQGAAEYVLDGLVRFLLTNYSEFIAVDQINSALVKVNCCINRGGIEIVNQLLKHGCNTELVAAEDTISSAIFFENIEFFRILNSRGDDVQAHNNLALCTAVRYEQYDIADTLIELGADVHAPEVMEATTPDLGNDPEAVVYATNYVVTRRHRHPRRQPTLTASGELEDK